MEKYFEGLFKQNRNRNWLDAPVLTEPKYLYKFKDIEQANVTIIMPGCKYNDTDVYANLVLHNMFGGGMSSRLFQDVREKQGLAYNLYSYPTQYINNGTTEIYVGTNLKSVKKALNSIKKLVDDVKNNGFTEKELNKGIMQLKTTYIMGQESTSALMRAYGKSALFNDELFDIDDRIKHIEEVTLDDVHNVMMKTFDLSNASIAYVGPEIDGDLLNCIK